jgi:hypothetical protein
MPAPPPGGQYEIWLLGGDERISIGVFIPDSSGRIEFTYSDPDGANLISRFDRFEITFEPSGDTDPESSGLIAYSFTLPEEGMIHVRYLLAAFSATPDDNALMQGLYTNTEQIAKLAKEMQTAFEGGDQASVRQKAETALNLLVGAKSPNYYKDWNGDGKIEPRESYGLLFNGELGYIQAVLSETEVTMTTAGATEYMLANGEAVKTCTQNLAPWALDLRDLLLAILNSTSEAETSESIRALVALTDQMLNGIDADNNGKIDMVSGECGAAAAYEYAYHMADMPILRTSLDYQLTVVAGFTPGPTSAVQNSSGSTPVVSTPKPANTKKPVPTQKPKATKKPNPSEDKPDNPNKPTKKPKN